MSVQTKLIRYKSEIPISQRLNDWIADRVKNIRWILVDNELSSSEILEQSPNKLKIYSGGNEDNIFGGDVGNINFRAWHDQVHIINKLDLSLISEIQVAFLQAAELPEDWYEEKLLIMSEVIGQNTYFALYNKFPDNQRDFTRDILIQGKL
jgi:hypothetical protein